VVIDKMGVHSFKKYENIIILGLINFVLLKIMKFV
jgi:hypothetical protein